MVAIWAIPDVVRQCDPFFVVFCFAVLWLVVDSYVWQRATPRGGKPPRRKCAGRSRQIVTIIAALAGGATVWFEWYFSRWCPLDSSLQAGTERMLRANVRLLDAARLPYWADFGTLLQVLRNSGVNPWDADSDFSTEYAGEEVVVDLIQRFGVLKREMGMPDATITYLKERKILQIRDGLPHSDIWFWERSADGQTLRNHDFTNFAPERRVADVLPVHSHYWSALNLNVSLARDSALLAHNEFGSGWKHPWVARVQCLEILFLARASLGTYCMMLLALAVPCWFAVRASERARLADWRSSGGASHEVWEML